MNRMGGIFRQDRRKAEKDRNEAMVRSSEQGKDEINHSRACGGKPLMFTNNGCAPDNGRAIERGSRGSREEPVAAKEFAG